MSSKKPIRSSKGPGLPGDKGSISGAGLRSALKFLEANYARGSQQLKNMEVAVANIRGELAELQLTIKEYKEVLGNLEVNNATDTDT